MAENKREVDRVARALMAEWERVEGPIVGTSYVATFADLARVAIAEVRGSVEVERMTELLTAFGRDTPRATAEMLVAALVRWDADRPECSNRVMIQSHKVGDHPDVCGICSGEWPNISRP